MTSLAGTEKGFQQAVVTLARLLQWRVHYTRDSRGSPHGWPDLVLCREDRLLFRELKTTTGRLTLEQEEWGALLTRAGMDWEVWRPGDWTRIEATLRVQQSLAETGGGVGSTSRAGAAPQSLASVPRVSSVSRGGKP